MENYKKFDEDKQIIGTPREMFFRQMCNEAGLFAIKDAKERDLPVTYIENLDIVKEYPDGSKEILGQIPPPVKITKRIYDLNEK